MLRLGGYRVATADSAAAACAILQSRAPDLILLDLHLPSQAALSLARQLRSLPAASGLPLLALVAAFEPSDLAAASSTGFDACLAQPFSRVGLLAAAAQARKRRRDLRA
jgi:CheY-like chemotaxis protein